jgi:hypothetical protein
VDALGSPRNEQEKTARETFQRLRSSFEAEKNILSDKGIRYRKFAVSPVR